MSPTPANDQPLASFVLRVVGPPTSPRYELHDLRTGLHHRFRRADDLARFLRMHTGAFEPEAGDTAAPLDRRRDTPPAA